MVGATLSIYKRTHPMYKPWFTYSGSAPYLPRIILLHVHIVLIAQNVIELQAIQFITFLKHIYYL